MVIGSSEELRPPPTQEWLCISQSSWWLRRVFRQFPWRLISCLSLDKACLRARHQMPFCLKSLPAGAGEEALGTLWFLLLPGSQCRRGRVFSPFSYHWAPCLPLACERHSVEFDFLPPHSNHPTQDLKSGPESRDGWGRTKLGKRPQEVGRKSALGLTPLSTSA